MIPSCPPGLCPVACPEVNRPELQVPHSLLLQNSCYCVFFSFFHFLAVTGPHACGISLLPGQVDFFPPSFLLLEIGERGKDKERRGTIAPLRLWSLPSVTHGCSHVAPGLESRSSRMGRHTLYLVSYLLARVMRSLWFLLCLCCLGPLVNPEDWEAQGSLLIVT